MRCLHVLARVLIAAVLALPAAPAFAQFGGGGGRGGGGQHGSSDNDEAEAAEKRKKEDEWNGATGLNLPNIQNAGPCPFVKVLYDASRYMEFKDGHEASNAVGYTGEIQKLSSGCLYKGSQPIHIEIEVLFAFGRGPQATSPNKTYRYWVAVTDRNQEVLAKEYFDIRAEFPQGQDRVLVTDSVNGITIPRATDIVSGANFEVLVGFDVTPEMVAFNRDGKRFRVNATASAQTASAPPPAQ